MGSSWWMLGVTLTLLLIFVALELERELEPQLTLLGWSMLAPADWGTGT